MPYKHIYLHTHAHIFPVGQVIFMFSWRLLATFNKNSFTRSHPQVVTGTTLPLLGLQGVWALSPKSPLGFQKG